MKIWATYENLSGKEYMNRIFLSKEDALNSSYSICAIQEIEINNDWLLADLLTYDDGGVKVWRDRIYNLIEALNNSTKEFSDKYKDAIRFGKKIAVKDFKEVIIEMVEPINNLKVVAKKSSKKEKNK